jgi:hypothetical protein
MTESQPLPRPDEETPQAQAERLLVQIKEPHLEPHDGNWDSDCTPCKAQLELECCAVTIVEAYRSALAASQARLHRLEQAICPSGQLNGDAIVGLAKCHRQDSELLDGLDAEDGVTMIRETIGALRWRAEQADQQRRSAEEREYRALLETEEYAKRLQAAEAGRAPLRSDGAGLIAAERRRQVEAEGWTPDHDDTHTEGELTAAACCYVFYEGGRLMGLKRGAVPRAWPWEPAWWKPSNDPTRNLVKAGALIAAEIDRRLREAVLQGSRPPLELQEKKDDTRVDSVPE